MMVKIILEPGPYTHLPTNLEGELGRDTYG